MKKSSTDLTVGNITKNIILFSLPIFVGTLFQNLYNSVDAIVVGHFVGTTSLAAVTSCSDISMLLTGFFTGLATGAGVLFSRFFGKKDYDSLHKAIHTTLLFSLILGIIMVALGIIGTPLILKMSGCPADVYGEAEVYLRIYLIGILFTALYNVGSGVLRAVGDSKTPFYYLVIASITNIVLDLFFVVYLNMGTMGVAIATICSQLLSVILVIIKMLRSNDVYKLVISDLKIESSLIKEIISLGIPAAIQASLIAISNIFVQRYVNSFGSAAMAGIGSAKKIDKFIGMIPQSIGLAMATFVSQNIGAGKEKRAFDGIRIALIISLVISIGASIPLFIFAPFFVGLFTEDSAAAYYGVQMIRTMLPFFCFMCFNQVYSNCVRGFGRSFAVMILSLIGMIGCRQLYLAIGMHIVRTPVHVYIGFPLGWFFSALFVFIYYLVQIKIPYKNSGKI